MKISIILISTFLSWATYDTHLFRRRKNFYAANDDEISFELTEEVLQKKKKTIRHRLDVIPRRYRGLKKPVRAKLNYFSSKPRDVRSSDQKKIRRRFNNM
jgi:hypothetical protein